MIDEKKTIEDIQTNPPTQPEGESTPAEVVAEVVPNDDDDSTDDNMDDISPDAMKGIVNVLQAEISQIRQLLEEQTQKTEQSKKQYISIAADFENYRKRTEREKEEQEKKGKKQTITELLSVVDNFERARTQIKPTTEGETAIHKSYQGVYKNLVDGLKKLGVSAMRPEGEMFDPQYHEAMLREPTNEYPEGTVIEQLVRGYVLGDQVLRHAMVKVATSLDTSTTETETDSIDQNSSE